MRYVNAWIEKAYFDERPVQRVHNVAVEIGPRTILIEWQEGRRRLRYEGVRSGQGHFLLRGDNGDGDATLHRFQDSAILEGFWKQHGTNGFWRVHLPTDAIEDEIRLPDAPRAKIAPRKSSRQPARRRLKVAA